MSCFSCFLLVDMRNKVFKAIAGLSSQNEVKLSLKMEGKEAVILSHRLSQYNCPNTSTYICVSLIDAADLPELLVQEQFLTPTDPERMSNVRTRETIDVRQTTTNSTIDLLSDGVPMRLSSLVSSTSHSHSRLTVMFSVLVTRRGRGACGVSINLGSMSSSST